MAIARATGTTTAGHDGYNDGEKHDRADYRSGNNTSGPNCYSGTGGRRAHCQTVAAITTQFACATLVIVGTVSLQTPSEQQDSPDHVAQSLS